MKKTISVSRPPEAEKQFNAHLARLKQKYPDVENWLSEGAIDILRAEGIEIERGVELNSPHYIMTSSHPYPDTKKHLVLYFGESDYAVSMIDTTLDNPENPRYQTFVNNVKSTLCVLAALHAQKKAYKDYAIVVKSEGTLNHTPHIHLLVY